MRITTLSENLTYKTGLIAEHGLSLLIEINGKKILFDTGQGYTLVRNARQLGIDLADIDDIVISHGHYDHTGGLEDLLDLNVKATVFLKEKAFSDKLKGAKKNIGMSSPEHKIRNRSRVLEEPLEIEKGVFVMTDIPIKNQADTGFSGFITDTGNGFKADEFEDELYLTVVDQEKLSVLSGCSHRGISNILSAATDHFNLPVNLVLGGFHLKDCREEQYDAVVEHLLSIDPESVGVCHCTGIDKFCELRRDIGEQVFYNACGSRIKLG